MVKLHIMLDGRRLRVTPWIWRSWSGRRMLDGREAHGPVYALGTDLVGVGVRACECSNCNTLHAGWRLS